MDYMRLSNNQENKILSNMKEKISADCVVLLATEDKTIWPLTRGEIADIQICWNHLQFAKIMKSQIFGRW